VTIGDDGDDGDVGDVGDIGDVGDVKRKTGVPAPAFF